MSKLPAFVTNDCFPTFPTNLWKLLYSADPFVSEQTTSTYPKYNIWQDEKDKNITHIVMAVAGMTKENISLTTLKNKLSVTYSKDSVEDETTTDSKYIARHISNRDWSQTFTAPEGYDLEVLKAKIEDGLLTIDVKSYIPEELKEKQIPIEF
jgi:molecular chaperone IbpA